MYPYLVIIKLLIKILFELLYLVTLIARKIGNYGHSRIEMGYICSPKLCIIIDCFFSLICLCVMGGPTRYS